ncbi:MAG TPA: VOC family protein [Anaerolineales bacterium]|nr:VOC family protein [Anaerolineales bacterium]
MNTTIQTEAIHHLTLTVTDLARAVEFYTDLLGFQRALDLSPSRVLLANGKTILALTEAPDPTQAIRDDRFNENRVGLDHLSFNVSSRTTLEEAVRRFDRQGISHGEIKDLGPDLGIYVLAFRDPDNIQLELTAPYG